MDICVGVCVRARVTGRWRGGRGARLFLACLLRRAHERAWGVLQPGEVCVRHPRSLVVVVVACLVLEVFALLKASGEVLAVVLAVGLRREREWAGRLVRLGLRLEGVVGLAGVRPRSFLGFLVDDEVSPPSFPQVFHRFINRLPPKWNVSTDNALDIVSSV